MYGDCKGMLNSILVAPKPLNGKLIRDYKARKRSPSMDKSPLALLPTHQELGRWLSPSSHTWDLLRSRGVGV